jgi:ribosomal protein S18 acetylase RimI-like enzyme
MRRPAVQHADFAIHELTRLNDAAIVGLCDVLIDCVNNGASVGFMLPMTRERAERFWRKIAADVACGDRAILVASDSLGICGTVQLALAMPDNQPHRADLCKMLVHCRARRRGLGSALMTRAEHLARARGRTLLVLDAVTNGDAARLYSTLGWQRAGDIPHYALMPDGAPCSTTYFYKSLV